MESASLNSSAGCDNAAPTRLQRGLQQWHEQQQRAEYEMEQRRGCAHRGCEPCAQWLRTHDRPIGALVPGAEERCYKAGFEEGYKRGIEDARPQLTAQEVAEMRDARATAAEWAAMQSPSEPAPVRDLSGVTINALVELNFVSEEELCTLPRPTQAYLKNCGQWTQIGGSGGNGWVRELS
jgi:hypothetical protein